MLLMLFFMAGLKYTTKFSLRLSGSRTATVMWIVSHPDSHP
jgi:hypothetical protein